MTPWELIWSGRSQELASLGDLAADEWVGATQADIRQYVAQETQLRHSAEAAPAIPEFCVVMMIKDEADIIGINLRWLYRLGIRRFVVLDNNSTDSTGLILRTFRDELHDTEMVIVDDGTLRYTQSEKTTGLSRLASSFWPDVSWIFPIDADEILCAQDGLCKLRDVPSDIEVLVLQKVNHYLTESYKPHDHAADAPSSMPKRTHLGEQPPKIALRPFEGAIIAPGNHDVRVTGHRRVVYGGGLSFGLYYREFQFRSFDQFKRKIINGGRALLAAERETGRSSGGDHWKSWFGVYEQQGEDGLRAVFQSIAIRSDQSLVFDPWVTGSKQPIQVDRTVPNLRKSEAPNK